jgi:hypothetical protein
MKGIFNGSGENKDSNIMKMMSTKNKEENKKDPELQKLLPDITESDVMIYGKNIQNVRIYDR